MVGWDFAERVASTGLAIAAWAVARSYRPHIYVAAFATWMVVVDWLRAADSVTHLSSHLALDRSFALSFSFFFLALAVHYFLGRSARWILVTFAAVVVLLLTTPTLSTTAAHRLYFAVYDATTAIVWGIVVYTALFRRGVRPDLSHLTLVLYAATDTVAITFPLLKWRVDEWRVVVVSQIVCVVASIVAHLVFLHRRRSTAGQLVRTRT